MRLLFVLLFLLAATAAPAASRPTSIAELASYAGPDREALLYAGAKAEGKVVWYTSLAGVSYKELARAFEAKYPGVKIDVFRASGSELTVRLAEEAKARRHLADTIETTETNLMFMREGGLLRPYFSPHFAAYPEEAKEKGEQGLYYWAVARESYIGFAYNKKLLPRAAVPKGFDGLLHPELKGRMGVTISEPSYKVIGAVLKVKGEEFVRRLKGQEITLHAIIPPALLDLIGAGEIVASPAIFRNHVLVAIEKGSPVEWVPLDLVPTNVGGAAIVARPPHPHAALLLADFLLGPEGQGVLERYHYGNAAKNYGFKRWRPEVGMTTERYERENQRWEKLLREIARK